MIDVNTKIAIKVRNGIFIKWDFTDKSRYRYIYSDYITGKMIHITSKDLCIIEKDIVSYWIKVSYQFWALEEKLNT